MPQPVHHPLHQFTPVAPGEDLRFSAAEWNSVRDYVSRQLVTSSEPVSRMISGGFLRVKLLDDITDDTADKPKRAAILDFNPRAGEWIETDFLRLVWRWRDEEIEAGTVCAAQAIGENWFVVPVECPPEDGGDDSE
ncbi:MAG: hypothetical protein KF777_15810 [Planctomycetaceae bacterium]|nr:hypothetical protein [Planctomycetaceae bacterium]